MASDGAKSSAAMVLIMWGICDPNNIQQKWLNSHGMRAHGINI